MNRTDIARQVLKNAAYERVLNHKPNKYELAAQEVAAALTSDEARDVRILMTMLNTATVNGVVVAELAAFENSRGSIPIKWQQVASEGHSGTVLVGEITSVQYVEVPDSPDAVDPASPVVEVWGYGQIANWSLTADLRAGLPWRASVGIGYVEMADTPDSETGLTTITRGEVIEVTILQDAGILNTRIELINDPESELIRTITVAVQTQLARSQSVELEASCGCESVNDALLTPPKEWFEPFATSEPFHFVTDGPEAGRAFGVVAPANACHIGMGGCEKPAPNGLVILHRKGRVTDQGQINTAVMVSGIGHAKRGLSGELLAAHYDRDDAAVADVRYHYDKNVGLLAFGALRPNVTKAAFMALAATPVSMHRRNFKAGTQLAPGLKMPRSGDFLAGVAFVAEPGYNPAGADLEIAASAEEEPTEHSEDVILLEAV